MEGLHFRADTLENDINDYGVLVIGFYAKDHYLIIQLNMEEEDDDHEDGMNTYHIERDDQSFGNYGGVESIILANNQIIVMPDDRGLKFLKCREIKIDFEVDSMGLEKLKKNLFAIFKEKMVWRKS